MSRVPEVVCNGEPFLLQITEVQSLEDSCECEAKEVELDSGRALMEN
jgi:hypothetical protein